MATKKNGSTNGRTATGRYTKGHNGGAHGVPGRSGRPSLEFKGECERLSREVLLPTLARYVAQHGPDDAGYRWAAEQLLSHGIGKPVQTITHQGNAAQPVEVSVEHRQDLARRIDRLAARFATRGVAEDAERN